MLQGPWLLGFAPTSAWSAINALLCTSAFWGVFFFFFGKVLLRLYGQSPYFVPLRH